MQESYRALKEKALGIFLWTNKYLSIAVLAVANLLFLFTLVFKLSFIFMISLILMTITMGAIFYGIIKSALASEETPYFIGNNNQIVEWRPKSPKKSIKEI